MLSGDARATPICGMSGRNAAVLRGPLDSTRRRVPLAGLESKSGQRLRFRFTLTDGELYSFWVSRTEAGHSGGFLGGGAFNRSAIIDDPD